MSEEALTVADVARALRVDQETVRKWLRAGTLEGFQLPGGEWRVWPSVLERWLAARTNEAA